jgi:hypothetical protein
MAVQVALRNTPSTAVMTTKMTRLMQDLSVVLVGRDAANLAKAKRRALFLPTALVLLASIGMAPLAMTETRP